MTQLKYSRGRAVLLATVAMVAALAIDADARAQTAASPSTASPQPPTAEQTGDIVVTATRRAERLRDVPIAVAAFSQQQLTSTRVQSTLDLPAITPGLTVSKQGGGQVLFLRGVGSTDSGAAQESAIATYVDGVYIASPYAAFSSLNNIERVEVLKGPQGTLFGRNATGGLIQIVTKTPTQDPHFEGSASYGNYDTIAARAYATTGITPVVAADIAVSYQHQGDGFGRNLVTGSKVGLNNEFVVRSKWVADGGGPTKFTLIGDYAKRRNRDDRRAIVPGAVAIDGTMPPVDFQDVYNSIDPRMRTMSWGTSGRLDQELGGVDLVSITAYRKINIYQQFDNTATANSLVEAKIYQFGRTFTQEVQLLSPPGASDKFSWIAGAFFLKDKGGYNGPYGLGLFGPAFGGVGLGIQNVIKSTSYSAFAEATYNLTDRLRLRAGARYTIDKRSFAGKTDVLAPDLSVIATTPTTPASVTYKRPTWRAVLDYKTEGDTLLYGSYSRGFKSGNFNAVDSVSPPFRPERVDAYELGAKGNALNRVLRFDAAAFYYKYSDLQLPRVGSGTTLVTTNAAGSEIYGVDLSTEWKIAPRLTATLSGSYLHARFTSYPAAQCSQRLPSGQTAVSSCNVSGNSIPRAPKWSFSTGANYTLPKTSIGEFGASVLWYHSSGFPWEPDNRLRQSSYDLVSGELRWTSPGGGFGASVFAKNLSNAKYSLYTLSLATGDAYIPAPPRTYGVELTVKY